MKPTAKFFAPILLTLCLVARCLAVASPYADDFPDLSGWTPSGMAVAAGEVKASVDNSTVGKITRVHESAVPPANSGGSVGVTLRLAFDFVVDKTMTTNTQVSVSLLDSASSAGCGVYCKQGVGIVSGFYLTTPGAGGGTTTLATWAELVNGRYHVEVTCNPGSFFGWVRLYDPSGNFVASGTLTAGSVNWFNVTRLVIESNSTKTTVSRLAIDPNLVGGPTTGKYFANVAYFSYQQADGSPVDLYIPGGGNVTDELVYFHGSGQSVNFNEMTTLDTGGPVIQGFLKRGTLLVVPAIPDGLGGNNSWGNDYGSASALSAIAFGRSQIGNSQAPLHLLSYSMGTVTAGRLIGYDGVLNVKSWDIIRGACDLARLEQNTFVTQIDTAWGLSHSANYAAAQVAFARGNPLGLLNSNPSAFANVAIFMDYSTTGDTVLPQTDNCVAFDAMLTTKGIPHQSSVKPYATHTEPTTVGDATAHLARLDQGISSVVVATREAILTRSLPGNYTVDGTAGKLLQSPNPVELDSGTIADIAEAVADDTDIAAGLHTISTNLDAKVSEVSGAASGGLFNDENVPPERTVTLKPSSKGVLTGDRPLTIPVGKSPTIAIDFACDMPTNGRIQSVDGVSIVSYSDGGAAGGITFGTPGQEDSDAKVRATGVTEGTYVIKVEVTYDTGATQLGLVTLKAKQVGP